MKYNKLYNAPFPMIEVELEDGEMLRYEPSAMVYSDAEIDVDLKFNRPEGGGGLLGSIVRTAVSGENMFIMHATAEKDGAKVALASPVPGDIIELKLGKEQWRLRDGSFLACDENVNFKLKRQSIGKALFADTGGLFVMETTGTGTMLIDTCGAMHRIDLPKGKKIFVDNTHLVAWSSNLDYKVKLIGAGELFTCEFVGPGYIILQTNCRNSPAKKSND